MLRLRQLLPISAFALVLGSPIPSSSQTIINEWSNVKAPPAPELKAVTIEPKTTALLMSDFVKQGCNQQRRPRCLATLPKAKNLLAQARAVMYTASGAVFRGMKVIAPLDVISDVNTYMEQYVAYHFMNAPLIAGNVTLTSVDMMKF